jgi:gliding motility-associated-like protein/uncharacterized repeat protein (TIGR01451 family)
MRKFIPNHFFSDSPVLNKNSYFASSELSILFNQSYLLRHLRSSTMNFNFTFLNTKCFTFLTCLLFSIGAMAQNDLSLTKTIDRDSAGVGDMVIFTLTVNNQGMTDANGVTVTDMLPTGVDFVSAVPMADYNSGTGVWTVGNIPAATATTTLTLTGMVNTNAKGLGIIINIAEISASDPDDDSTPSNLSYNEDDIATACFSVPIPICPILNETVTLEAPAGLTNYNWYQGVTLVSTDSLYEATEAGSYTFSADFTATGCPTGSCCPTILETKCMDLALYKELEVGQNTNVAAGDVVDFVVTVVNQGDFIVDSIQITDYIPTNSTYFDNGEWTMVTVSNYNRLLTVANGDLPAGGLLPGQSDTARIRLQLASPLAAGTLIENFSEISSATDDAGDTFTDIDSTPDATDDDLLLVDNEINGNGKVGGDEDDHDKASVTINGFDLALIKQVTTPVSGMVSSGDDVTFTITVINQGMVDAANIVITDYFNTSEFTLDIANALNIAQGVAGWSINGDMEGEVTLAGTLAAGASTTVDITMNVKIGVAYNSELINRAEISSATDVDGNPQTDIDSTPDGVNDDLYLTDDDINGDGKNGGDEDDHDPATIVIDPFDLALIKVLANGQPELVEPGDDVIFMIIVTNQGEIAADNIEITDYIPAEMTLSAAELNWMAAGANATRTLTAGTELPATGLAPNQSVNVSITLTLASPIVSGTVVTNLAEISSATDDQGNVQTDVDSTPDNIDNNDTYLSDNDINGDGNNGGDEDDHDLAQVTIEPFDLALYKGLGPIQLNMVEQGDDITYTITVVNQGAILASNVEISDYIPTGMILSPLDMNGWTVTGTTASMTYPGIINPGGSQSFNIVLRLDASLPANTELVNWAEISAATDDEGNPQTDVDSTPDDIQNNDTYTNDNDISGNGNDGEDEDDHDQETVIVLPFDLALFKKLAPGQVQLVEPDDDVTYQITIVNQGLIAASNIEVTDYIPTGMTLSSNDGNGWSVAGSNAIISLPGTLAAGASMNVNIVLRVASPLAANTQLWNWAEISAATDASGNPQEDVDSTPDGDQTNDTYLSDNNIDGNGKNSGDEDDHDPALVIVEPFDLALIKELAPGQSVSVEPGDDVNYRITVYNQGMITASNIEVTDYIPSSMILSPNDVNGWTSANGNASITLPGALASGFSQIVEITLQLDAPIAANTRIINWAEISNATDDAGNFQTDYDSTPDNVQNNDIYLVDNDVNGDALNNMEDEDDHDAAEAVVVEPFDLALIKQLGAGEDAQVSTNDNVTFNIRVFNQGAITADQIEITDYIPTGMILNDGNWAAVGTNATRLLNAGDELPAGGLTSGASVIVQITLQLTASFPSNTELVNWAEISAATDNQGNTQTDFDSTPDNDKNNDTYLQNDEINGYGLFGEDEDDHDPESLFVNPFDLALTKVRAVGQSELVEPGDDVTFTVTVTNQGLVTAQNIEVTDYIPTGMTLNDGAWLGVAGNMATIIIAGPLTPGQSMTRDITVTLDNPLAANTVLQNWAEISASEDLQGNMNPDDVDSNPDNNLFNDTYLLDNQIADDGKNGGDEDDHDPAQVTIEPFDLALYKQLAINEDGFVSTGDDVTFNITVVNQGSINADNIEITDYIPTGMVLNDPNWTDNVTTAVRVLNAGDELPATGLFPGQVYTVSITLRVQGDFAANTPLINWAEISSSTDDEGNVQEDIDSTADDIDNNDIYVSDDEINGNGKNGEDEDDHDLAQLIVEPFDLAMFKELAIGQNAAVQPGEDVTFTITVVNQGMVNADNIELTDYIPTGLTLNDTDWAQVGSNAVLTLTVGNELPGAGLAYTETVSVDITFTVNSPLAANLDIVNWAEISNATDNLGNDQDDVDSTPDDMVDNDTYLQDNDIDGNGLAGGDEDDHDQAVISTEVFDLALWKTLGAGQSNQVEPGDLITFTINIISQGMIPADNIIVTDYLSPEMTLEDVNWIAAGANATRTLDAGDELPAGGLLPGETVSVDIAVRLASPLAANTELMNWAEITDATDDQGNPVVDTDSTPDDDNTNDTYLQDNDVDGDGNNGGDEDDHDGEIVNVKVFDLALIKVLAPGEDIIVEPGDIRTFNITIFNQGAITADNIEVSDYMPTGMTLMDANWTFSGSIAMIVLNAGDELPAGGLAMGESVVVPITLQVPMALPTGTRLTNWAEISNATDESNNPMTDIDSDMDADVTNDLFLIDNYVGGNGQAGDDEDNHDPAYVMYEVFDLALRKTTDQILPVVEGDEVTFTHTIFNQGTITAQEIEIFDHIPAGFELVFPSINGWSYAGSLNLVKNEYNGQLAPGDSVEITIVLRVLPGACLDNLINISEISYAENQSGANMVNNDIDSNPDNDLGDTVIDDIIDQDGMNNPGDDEDDHDYQYPPVFDLALRKTTAQVNPVKIGEEVSYSFEIYNQGNVTAQNIQITDLMPEGFILSPNDMNGWADSGNGMITVTLTGPITGDEFHDGTLTIDLLLQVTPDACEGDLTNRAEITYTENTNGTDITDLDIDSDSDSDFFNDPFVDDEITDKGVTDEDDHDEAVVTLFDLALRKIANFTEPLQWGEDGEFTITVFNQSPEIVGDNISVTEYIPTGFALSPNDGNGWTASGTGQVAVTGVGPIAAGDSVKVSMVLRVMPGIAGGVYVNNAEITYAEDDNGTDLTAYDFDSTPDTDNTNDLIIDNAIDDKGENDEDDHDFEDINVILLVTANISGSIFKDCGNNGIRDAGETGFAGVIVTLSGTDILNQNINNTTTTIADGSYSFGDLYEGIYTVNFGNAPTPGLVFSMKDQGNDDTIDSDVNPNNGNTDVINLGATDITNVDAGYRDVQAPEFVNVPTDVAVDCGSIPNAINPSTTDNCDTDVEVTMIEVIDQTACPYTITRTWTATDDCGNTATTSQVITVKDDVGPVITTVHPGLDGILNGQTVTVNCQNIPNMDVTAVTATDECCDDNSIIITFEEVIEAGDCLTDGYMQLMTCTWTAKDCCGNTSTYNVIVEVVDTQAPNLFNVPLSAMISCEDAIPAAGNVAASDNCDNDVPVTMTEDITLGNCPQESMIVRTWTVTDDCGNTNSAQQMITITDSEAPVLSATPQDITVDCANIPTAATLTATDNCDNNVEVFFAEGVPTGNACPYEITRTWTASDACGNAVTHTQTVTVEDNEAPTLAGLPSDTTIECEAISVAPTVTATDNCDNDVIVAFTENMTGDNCNGLITRTWTASDNCGNTITETRTVMLMDNTAPILAGVPIDTTAPCDDLPTAAIVTATDNCDDDVTVDFDETIDGTLCNGTVTRTWIATDNCGNKTSAQQVITLGDTTAPVLAGVPANMNVECAQMPTPATVTATDNCDNDVTVSMTENLDGLGCSMTLTRIWTATDDCGNTTSAQQVITLTDDSAPTLSGVPANTTAPCDNLPTAPTVTAADNCDVDVSVSFSETVDGTLCNGTVIRTWTATDDCGNTISAQQVITLGDTTPPVLTGVPNDASAECDDMPTIATVTVSDNCDNDIEVTFNEIETGTGCSVIVTRTWTAMDDCGNTAVATQVITIGDQTAPTLVGVPANMMLECDDAIPTPPTVTATDNCDDNVAVFYAELFDIDDWCNQEIKRTWTAVDECGNTVSASQTITIKDTQAPTITTVDPNLNGVPSGTTIVVDCDDVFVLGEAAVIATDNCHPDDITITMEEIITQIGDCENDGFLFEMRCAWIATDMCGNESEYFVLIQVQDTTAPMIMDAPADVTVECTDIPDIVTLMAMDGCDDNPSITFGEMINSGNCDHFYTIVRTWTATDDCGNATSVTQLVSVRDTEAPMIVGVPNDATVDCANIPAVPSNVKGVDACDTDPDLTFNETDSGTDCPYTLTRTWTSTDDCGNIAVATQTIVVTDNVAPTLAGVPNDVTVDCDDVPNAPTVTATDNCDDNVPVSFNETEEGEGCETTIIRTWVAIDDCGNTTVATQEINVTDTEAPVLSAMPAELTVECNDIPTVPTITATDNCEENIVVNFTETVSTGGCPYVIQRMWTAEDECGNMVMHMQLIFVNDDISPVFVDNPADITVNCGGIPAAVDCIATDNCDDEVDVQFAEIIGAPNTGNGCSYEIKRIWEATDECGNVTVIDQIITVSDNEAPTLTFNNPLLQGLQDGDEVTLDCGMVAIFGAADATATDNCDEDPQIMFMEGEIDLGDCETDGFFTSLMCTWIAKDDCGNETSITLTITITDNEAPVFMNVPADMTIECDGTISATQIPDVSDACSEVTLTSDNETTAGDCPNELVMTRTWTATDACGNTAVTTQTITVEDTTAPVLVAVPEDLTVNINNGETVPAAPAVTANDNCAQDVTVTFTENILPEGCMSVVLRTWIAIDDCGNTSEATQVITVFENNLDVQVLPVFAGCDDNDGSVTLSPATLTYTWNDGFVGNERTDLASGDYSIVANDGTGCEITILVTVGFDCPCQVPVVDSVVTEDAGCGEDNGSATITLVGNMSLYNFDWIPDMGTANGMNTRTDLPAGEYLVVITFGDDVDCDEKVEFTIGESGALNVAVVSNTEASCDGGDGAVELSPATLTYNWSDGGTGETRNDLDAGTYTVVATNGTGCEETIEVTVTQAADLNAIVVSNTDASCTGGDGAVELSPATLTYDWSNGGTGATRNDLNAGTYTVIASDGTGCEETLEITVGQATAPVIELVSNQNAGCEMTNGAVELSPVMLIYNWSDGGMGATRNDLAPGIYAINAIDPATGCAASITLEVAEDECLTVDCDELFGFEELIATATALPAEICIPIPYNMSLIHDLTINGTPYTDDLGQCDTEEVVFYTYGLVVNVGAQGPYAVNWTCNNATLQDTVMNMDELVNKMNLLDDQGMWMNMTDDYGLTGGEMGAAYGELLITHIPTQITAVIQTNSTMMSMGTLLNIPTFGDNVLIFTNLDTGCADTLTVKLEEVVPPVAPTNLIDTEFAAMGMNCEFETPAYCMEIPYDEFIVDYTVKLNGAPYAMPFEACNFLSNHKYSYGSLPGLGIAGPYTITNWVIDGNSYNETFNDITELADILNQWDTNGEWVINAAEYTVEGGHPFTEYGSLVITQTSTGAMSMLEISTNNLPNSTYLTFPEGMNELVIIRNADGLADTLTVAAACVTPDYLSNIIDITQTDTICLNTSELMGEVVSMTNICEGSSTVAAEFTMINGENCVVCEGSEIGFSEACFVLCDEYGICDTTYMSVEVRAELSTLIGETMRIKMGETGEGNVLDNDNIPYEDFTLTVTYEPQFGTLDMNADGSFTYTPDEQYCNTMNGGRPDYFIYEVCTAAGCESMSVNIIVECGELIVFTGFSPNGDGINDFFRIDGLQQYDDHKVAIYNRWGNVVFTSKDYNNDWYGTNDGNGLPDGTYFYVIEVDGAQEMGYVQIAR